MKSFGKRKVCEMMYMQKWVLKLNCGVAEWIRSITLKTYGYIQKTDEERLFKKRFMNDL